FCDSCLHFSSLHFFALFIPALSLYYPWFFFFNATPTTEIYTLSLHDALPIYDAGRVAARRDVRRRSGGRHRVPENARERGILWRSEEHTSELQSPDHLVCRLLLEKKKKT